MIKRILVWALCAALAAQPVLAADNAVTLTVGSGVTMRTIDVGSGVQSSVVILGSTAGAAIYGTAGTANANVLTVQGIASGTAVPISGTVSITGLLLAQGSTTSGQSGLLAQAAVTTAAPSYTNAQTSPLNMDTAGNLRVSATGLAQGSTSSGQQGAMVMGRTLTSAPTDTTAQTNAITLTTAGGVRTDVATVAGTAASTGNGTVDAGTLRVNLTSNGTGVIAATQSGTWTVQPGNTANTTAWLTQPVSGTTGGASPARLISAASTNGTNMKASAGTLYSVTGINTTATKYYLKFYNSAGTPTCNSDTVVWGPFPVPASTDGNGFGVSLPVGLAFATGIAYCLTGGSADNDNTSAATGVFLNFTFK